MPKRKTPSLSLKDEQIFDSVDDLKLHIHKIWCKVSAYLGEFEPIHPDEIVISDIIGNDPIIGLKNVREVCVKRTTDIIYKDPLCIGYCGE